MIKNQKDKISENLSSILLWFGANDYEPWETKELMSSMSDQSRITRGREELREVIDRQLWSQEFYLGLMGFEFETQDNLYAYLSEVWEYVFNDGSLPQIEKYQY